jgi:hypothetical protein
VRIHPSENGENIDRKALAEFPKFLIYLHTELSRRRKHQAYRPVSFL